MASSVFQKILRSQSRSTTSRIIPLMKRSFLSPPQQLPNVPSLAVPENGDGTSIPRRSSKFFPSFSIGFFLNPNPYPPIHLVEADIDGAVSDDAPAIWADSVKKKRKRKMNKHKLRKLRKLTRRKT